MTLLHPSVARYVASFAARIAEQRAALARYHATREVGAHVLTDAELQVFAAYAGASRGEN